MTSIVTAIVTVLLSGVVAAIVASWLASKRAAGQQTQKTQLRLAALEGEIRDNVELASKPIIGSSKVSLLTEQWIAAREHLRDAPDHVEQALRAAYVEVERYNSSAEQARQLPYGAGYMDTEVKQQAEQAKRRLEEALRALGSDA
jgi:hypothetical protein